MARTAPSSPVEHLAILALDTTTRAGSIAIHRGGTVEAVFVGDPSRSHGERLPGDIAALLNRVNLRSSDIDLFAVVNGPGSFTGLRVGIAAIQGLAMAQGRKVVAVPALDAFAAAPLVGDGRVGVWMDAQRQQVFAAQYDKHGGRIVAAGPPVSWKPDEVIDAWRRDGGAPVRILIGDGIDLYRDRVEAAWPDARVISPAPPLAPIAAALAAAAPGLAVAPHAIVPIYVRASDAEIARNRRQRPE